MSRKRRQVGAIDRLASGRYRVRLVGDVAGERISIGTFRTKADAEQALAAAMADRSRGRWVRPDAGATTFADFAGQWLGARLGRGGGPLRPRVRELYEGQLRLHILPTFGTLPLGRIRPALVRAWYARLLEDGPGHSTTAKCYRLLRAILNTAVEEGLLAVNPCAIHGAGAERADERPLPTIDQVFALADAVKPRYRALVLLAALSGLRKGELFGLRREHVDLERGTVTVALQRQQLAHGELVVGPPKSDAGRRTVALPADALVPLGAHLAGFTGPELSAWVFTGDKGGPLREGVWQHEWTTARARLGLGHLHFHDLRHGAATMAAATGAGVKEIMYRIGHSSPQAALRYQHASASRDVRIAEGITELIRRERGADRPDS